MESIFFEKKGTKLILRYTPDNGVDWLFQKIVEEKQEHHIKNTFFVKAVSYTHLTLPTT